MEQYPNNLFQAVAANILAKRRGLKPAATIQKVAADLAIPVDQLAPYNEFLSRYQLSPQDFVGDDAANAAISPLQQQSAEQIKGYFKNQAQMMGGMSKDLARNQELALRDLAVQSGQARIRKSIANTMATEAKDPTRFSQMKDLSDRSQAAFQNDRTADISAAVGGLGGAIGGAALGKTPIKRSLFGAVAGAGGLLGGLMGGRVAEERRTGYDHGDVLKPYELAARLEKRIKTDAKVT